MIKDQENWFGSSSLWWVVLFLGNPCEISWIWTRGDYGLRHLYKIHGNGRFSMSKCQLWAQSLQVALGPLLWPLLHRCGVEPERSLVCPGEKQSLFSVRTVISAESLTHMCEHLYRSGGKWFADEISVLIKMPEIRSGQFLLETHCAIAGYMLFFFSAFYVLSWELSYDRVGEFWFWHRWLELLGVLRASTNIFNKTE